jgi:urease accessory protein UreE
MRIATPSSQPVETLTFAGSERYRAVVDRQRIRTPDGRTLGIILDELVS